MGYANIQRETLIQTSGQYAFIVLRHECDVIWVIFVMSEKMLGEGGEWTERPLDQHTLVIESNFGGKDVVLSAGDRRI